MSTWWNYVTRIAGTEEQKAIAAKSKIGPTVINRWANGSTAPSAQSIVQLARAYGRPPVEAFVAAGYLTPSEAADVIEVHYGPDRISDAELVAQIEIRLKEARDVMEAQTEKRTPREARQDQEGDLDASTSDTTHPRQPRAGETVGAEIRDRVARSVRARQRRED
ncbi:immunity repressor [Mycobacterium phage Avani]|uniref:Immunity repressor n=1 Tax=Mycobacterium phage Avani TaxID=2902841 RepID=I3WWY6_9CAUD|nr:transcriptional repressor [Mycobacterium phage Avani]AFL48014.1 immunity repressor [Mycobacterium phage Avani]